MEEVNRYYNGPITLDEAESYIQSGLITAARAYVANGYYLRRIRDDRLFEEKGYQNFEEYVRGTYNKDKGWASKCINVSIELSEGGDSPILSNGYQGYTTYQLVEIAYMTEEQREEATPDMTVKELKKIRKPQPAPEPEEGKVVMSQLPEVRHFKAGHHTIDDAYGATIAAIVKAYLDDGYAGTEKECEVTAFGRWYKVLKRSDITVFYTEDGCTVFDVENLRLESEYQYWHGNEAVDEPSQEPEPETQVEPEIDENSCPPGHWSCRRQEWGTGTEEQEIGHEDCVKCWDAWKKQKKLLDASAESERVRELEEKQEQVELVIDKSVKESDQKLETQQTDECMPLEEQKIPDENWKLGDLPQVKEKYLRALAEVFVQEYGQRLLIPGELAHLTDKTIEEKVKYFSELRGDIDLGDGVISWASEEIIEFCQGENDLGVCSYGRFATQVRKAMDAWVQSMSKTETEEVPTVIDAEFTEIKDPEHEDLTDMQIAQEELERAKNLLDECLKDVQDENNVHIRGMKIKVAALASLVCDMDDIENPPPKQEQPELPILKNNDQRADFVDDYETWPLWIETEETGERYYRYDLEDGTSMVIKVYHSMLFDGFTDGTYESKYREGYGRHEYYLLWPGKFFKDCEANRSTLIKKLKEVQRN